MRCKYGLGGRCSGLMVGLLVRSLPGWLLKDQQIYNIRVVTIRAIDNTSPFSEKHPA